MKVGWLGIKVIVDPKAEGIFRRAKPGREGLLACIGKRLAYVIWDGCSSPQAVSYSYIKVIHDATNNKAEARS